MKNLTVKLTKEDDQYLSTCLENHVASFGSTPEEALKNIKEALELWFDDRDIMSLSGDKQYPFEIRYAFS